MLSEEEVRLSKVIFKLLKQATNQQVVKDFLKENGQHFSAQNWDELYDKRIRPALDEGRFSVSDLRGLLQQVEEYGRQHTFMYQCTVERATAILSPERLQAVTAEIGLDNLLTTPLDLDIPEDSTIVDIRLSRYPNQKVSGLTIKVVEKRVVKSLIEESVDIDACRMTKVYSYLEKRAVSVAHLDDTGLLELRIASQDSQKKYNDLVRAMRAKIHRIIPWEGFEPVYLTKAKDKMLKEREILKDEIRYGHSTAQNDFGATIQLSLSAQEDNLSSDEGSMAALDSFLNEDGHVTGANIYIRIPDTDPVREIHLNISGEPNEFAVMAACSPGEYKHVRGKIIEFNR
ncbi:hypothetical protein [Pseudomonas sp.]|uniref:hypothetical protein n=1 Tax=Pseudomonas sp. TaxID=306 RepID=UPI0028A89A13|nr:hypothetical protein [Pseudomonas sp.]